MSLRTIDAAGAVAQLAGFDTIIDVRSPAEYAEDHLPGAVNWPVLDDEERRIVGTLYVQESPLAARKLGAALVSRNIARWLEQGVQDKPREWQPLVYCWRGGQRSGSLALVLDQIGFRTTRLEGGYKGFRTLVREGLNALPARFDFQVLLGRTGSGKTRLLQALGAAGAQVLDLEALACHRGSLLGGVPGRPQPAQKRFDTLLWQALRALDPARPVFVEAESRKIGALQLPDALVMQMQQQGRCVQVEMPEAARIALLLEDYAPLTAEPETLCSLLQGLVSLRGHATVERWQSLARAADWPGLLAELLAQHYDPLYKRSTDQLYRGIAQARILHLPDGGAPALQQACAVLLPASQPTVA
ncbi:tRNA 2-selenouridine(34) synthase MnmH [Aquabacterium sp.]|uniref:tRNA 2-selenouridine(34) synthase MnmH n=1 Tax=Aquabacterium sp. TaxID=1872578 RepID=UPI0037845E7E